MEIQKEKQMVREMFDQIAPRYDYLNHLLSMGIDKRWRRKAIRGLRELAPSKVLDVATGTGDLAMEAVRQLNCEVYGVDISAGMLQLAREKVRKAGMQERIHLQEGDSESLPYATDTFDVLICAFGVRNFEHLESGLQEMLRCLRSGGELVILEFSRPAGFPAKQVYPFYFNRVLPFIGRLISKHYRAYRYLPETVKNFPEREAFVGILEKQGFVNVAFRPLTGGVVCMYTARKPVHTKA